MRIYNCSNIPPYRDEGIRSYGLLSYLRFLLVENLRE